MNKFKSIGSRSAGKARRVFHRLALHLAILIGAMSIMIEQAPNLFSPQANISNLSQRKATSDELLKESIKESQQGKELLANPSTKPKEEGSVVTRLEDLMMKNYTGPARQMLSSFASDKLALWSVFSNLSTYSGLEEILAQPVKAYERETLRSEAFGVSSGFDQIIYRIHHENGGTSLVVAQVDGDSVIVSFYRSPSEIGESYLMQRFENGLWAESAELQTAQVEQTLLEFTGRSAVVLSASVGL